MEHLESITLPIELSNRNDGRGHHWGRTAGDKKRISYALLGFKREPFSFPVCLYVERIIGPKQRLWDSDSILRGNWKEIQDVLVGCGWFHDDSADWILSCDGRQNNTERQNGPATRVHIFTGQPFSPFLNLTK